MNNIKCRDCKRSIYPAHSLGNILKYSPAVEGQSNDIT